MEKWEQVLLNSKKLSQGRGCWTRNSRENTSGTRSTPQPLVTDLLKSMRRLVMSSPPHPLLHASMTGWIKFSNDDSSYYKPTKKTDEGWPPRFWKFILETDEQPPCEAAFVDPRRLGRIRLLDCAGDKIRQTPPLSENGPDPVRDKDMLTKGWFIDKVKSKRVPVKAFLLDQANISGVGNWVA